MYAWCVLLKLLCIRYQNEHYVRPVYDLNELLWMFYMDNIKNGLDVRHKLN